MNDRISNIAKHVASAVSDCLLALVTQRWSEVETMLRKELNQSTRINLYFEGAYFSVDYITKKIPDKFTVDEKRLIIEELHRNLVDWLFKTLFSSADNPANYHEKIKNIYYDTLNARNLAYSDPKNENTMVFKEILSREFTNGGLKLDKSFFDSLSSDITDSLNTIPLDE